MSRIRVPLNDLSAGLRELDEEASRYVGRVHRLREGDEFLAFDPEHAQQACVRVLSFRRGRVQCEVGLVEPAPCGERENVWLLLGVCKGDRFEWALREATALGVSDIVPTMMQRSSSSGARADGKRVERWRRILVQGARQCGRGDIPTLHAPVGLQEALGTLGDQSVLRLCLWEQAEQPAGRFFDRALERRGLALIVGPEGGMDEAEAEVIEAAGFSLVSMGPLILRTETAVIAALGAWRLCRG